MARRQRQMCIRDSFTAQPLFFETTTEWAAALQEMQTGSNVDETLDKLASKIDRMMKDVGLA